MASEVDYWVQHASRVIQGAYGDVVYIKDKNLLKFGENTSVGTAQETIMQLQGAEIAETYVSTNAITHIISDNAGNTGDYYLEGHAIDGSDLTFVTQTGTLNGTTAVALATPIARASRLENRGSSELVASSTVYVYEGGAVTSGVPDDDSEVHIVMIAGEDQSLKASTSFSSVDYGLITEIYGSINRKQSGGFANIRLKIREPGGVFKTKFKVGVATDGAGVFSVEFRPFLIVPKNYDVIMTADASVTGTAISAGFNALLATVA